MEWHGQCALSRCSVTLPAEQWTFVLDVEHDDLGMYDGLIAEVPAGQSKGQDDGVGPALPRVDCTFYKSTFRRRS